jgi:biopolymer transport protein TolR
MTVGSGGGQTSDLNVTPMIDILLVLLVIFMIITPLTPQGEAALIPQPPPPNAKPQVNQRTIVVQVLKGNGGVPELKINEDPVTFNELQPRLLDIYKDRAEKVMFVKADNDVAWATVAQVIDAAHAAGVDKVGLMTAQIEQAG